MAQGSFPPTPEGAALRGRVEGSGSRLHGSPLFSPRPGRRIDANVEDAQLNVDAAHTEILKYFQSVTSNRWLMVKIFLILIVFFIIFVVFLA